MWTYNYSNELMHYGVPGMKWGRRKSQSTSDAYNKMRKDAKKEYHQTDEYKAKRKRAIKIGATAAGTALAAYGSYKASQYLKSEAGRKATRAGEEHLRRNINTGKFLKGMNNLSKINSKEWGKKVNRDLMRDVDLVNKVSNSTREAAKYLYSTRKRR